ncbi:MAG: replication protein C, IncQ-type [Betaproteobacteria bacterium]|nr:replication protein C, IncQ-type [Betaproteobacteria bacterium]
MAIGLAGLFRPVIRGKRGWLEGLRQQWNGGFLEFAGPELDSKDMLVLLAIQHLALRELNAGQAQRVDGAAAGLIPAEKNRHGNRAVEAQAIGLQTSMAEMCRAIGRDPDDGRAHTSIRASLKRLQGVVVEARSGEEWATSNLIRGGAGRGRGAVTVSLNFRLTRAVLGECSYSRIDVLQLAELPPVAQILVAWLCCWRPGHGKCPSITIDSLCRHVWGRGSDAADAPHDALQRRRRQQIRAALAALPPREWRVAVSAGRCGGTARIERLQQSSDVVTG